MRVAVLFLFFLVFASPASAAVAEARVKDVAKELACLCGTCPRRPLDECECGWADQGRTRIREALEAGQDKQAIIAGFVQDYGQEIYSAPPKEGFNLLAWVMPFAALIFGGIAVRSVFRVWSRNREEALRPPGGDPPPASQAGDDVYRARLEQELRERDT